MKTTLNNTFATLRAAIVAGLAMIPAVAQAGEITLTSADGTVAITGEFVEFRELAYVVMYNDHELYVPVTLMHCEGADCLNLGMIELADNTAS